MRVTNHVKERFLQRYRLLFYKFQLENLDEFIPKLISQKCFEVIDWKSVPFWYNKNNMNPKTDQVFKYTGKNANFHFIVKNGNIVTVVNDYNPRLTSKNMRVE